eukprot:CAMPEP_0115465348 /NCGR_PEP_ID=MMETSP0271-20121206/49356_1 /TAXON_ID=71861 /ORGANISM="Scrippsiella trochoidea, Strain CCMP3099" /LENGTH=149 /DNA_ID=CAMNT_0002892289 /DNA_START=626 /DNA_END=1077 /DNA_ORIENTATION=+
MSANHADAFGSNLPADMTQSTGSLHLAFSGASKLAHLYFCAESVLASASALERKSEVARAPALENRHQAVAAPVEAKAPMQPHGYRPEMSQLQPVPSYASELQCAKGAPLTVCAKIKRQTFVISTYGGKGIWFGRRGDCSEKASTEARE